MVKLAARKPVPIYGKKHGPTSLLNHGMKIAQNKRTGANTAAHWVYSSSRKLRFSLILSLLLSALPATAQQTAPDIVTLDDTIGINSTLETLESFITLSNNQLKDIRLQQELIETEESVTEQAILKQRLARLREELRATKKNFREIAAGTDISVLQANTEQAFNLQEEIMALLKPAFQEMREITAPVRQKTALKEKIVYFEERLPVVEKVIANVSRLQAANTDEDLEKALDVGLNNWVKQQTFMQSELQAAEVQLNKLLAAESSITEASQTYLKSFFKKRGLYLFEAMLAILFVMLLSRYSYKVMKKVLPGFRAKQRSFQYRLLELIHRFTTLFFILLGPMLVFYLVEDWVFFSLGILLLFGFLWTLARALPLLWRQIHLFLNIGSVREGERIDFEGLPWLVERINLYCDLTNPVANMSLRVPINEMVDLKSRPFEPSEPWFPCKKGDWVILGDGLRAKVTGISPEMVQLIERGGTRVTYTTSDFLAQSPHNLATNFRIKETLGLSYSLQKESTAAIPETLHQFITQRAADEGYADQLLNLRVEFSEANTSSLDIVMIADFKGHLGDLYNRLRRALQRWSVEACTENGWEIPFPQMTLHGNLEAPVSGPQAADEIQDRPNETPSAP
jgi:hypothetical protein